MTDKIKTLAPEIWRVIQESNQVLLHCHPNPDQDSIGSALATKQVLESLGKQVMVIKGDSDLPSFVKYFPGGEEIVSKNIFEVDLQQFDLFLILDSSGLNRVSPLGEIVFPPNLKTVVIDHHTSNNSFGQINLVETNYPATAQIMFDLFTEWGVTLNSDIALCLMAGLQSDTGGFKYRGVNEHSFRVASELARLAPSFSEFLSKIFSSSSFSTIKFIGLGLNKAERFFNNQVIISEISFSELTNLGIGSGDTQNTNLSSMLRDVEGVEMSFVIIEETPGLTRISSRSSDGEKNNVAEILSHFGGGGHKVAAGATVAKASTLVREELIKILTQVLQ